MASATDNGLGNGADNGLEMGEKWAIPDDFPFALDQDVKELTRPQLKEMFKTSELAVIAKPYAPNLSLESLEKKNKDFLIDIIMTFGQSQAQKESSARTTKPDSLLFLVLNTLESIKGSALNPLGRQIVNDQGQIWLDYLEEKKDLTKKKRSSMALGLGVIIVAWDVFGEKLKPYALAWWEKMQAKKTPVKQEAKNG